MSKLSSRHPAIEGKPVEFSCPDDGERLRGHLWRGRQPEPIGTVIINPATDVWALYYHRDARFLASHGVDILTYGYRGIGRSRPDRLKGCDHRWRDWGERDFEGAVKLIGQHGRGDRRLVVGHSISTTVTPPASGSTR